LESVFAVRISETLFCFREPIISFSVFPKLVPLGEFLRASTGLCWIFKLQESDVSLFQRFGRERSREPLLDPLPQQVLCLLLFVVGAPIAEDEIRSGEKTSAGNIVAGTCRLNNQFPTDKESGCLFCSWVSRDDSKQSSSLLPVRDLEYRMLFVAIHQLVLPPINCLIKVANNKDRCTDSIKCFGLPLRCVYACFN
jgi:hypothetical protein